MIRWVKDWAFTRLNCEISEVYDATYRQRTIEAVPEGTTEHSMLGLRIAWVDLKLQIARTILGEWGGVLPCSVVLALKVDLCMAMYSEPTFWAKLKAKGIENGRN